MAWHRILHLFGKLLLYGGVLLALVGPWWAMQAAEGGEVHPRVVQLLQRGSIPLGAILACFGLALSWLAARSGASE